MSKFQVGDVVRIKTDSDFDGLLGVVVKVGGSIANIMFYYVLTQENSFGINPLPWSIDELEKVEP